MNGLDLTYRRDRQESFIRNIYSMYSWPRVAAERGECRVAVLCLDSEESGASVSERETGNLRVSWFSEMSREYPDSCNSERVSEMSREYPRS